MSLENQLGSIAARLRDMEECLTRLEKAMEKSLQVEKDKLQELREDLHSLNEQMRPRQ